jgi:hypothetical protein
MNAAIRLMTQAEFARDRGVSRAAVSQWKSRGILTEAAFAGSDKTGRLIYDVAVNEVRRNRDIGQSLGNGVATRTAPTEAGAEGAGQMQDGPRPPTSPRPPAPNTQAQDEVTGPAPAPARETIEDQLKRAKLEEQLRRNRIMASEEAERQGRLLAAADARQQMARVAGLMLQIFEGALPNIADAMAAQFGVPQRDVLHLLRAEMRKVRSAAARNERARSQDVERNVTARLEEDA